MRKNYQLHSISYAKQRKKSKYAYQAASQGTLQGGEGLCFELI